MKNLKLILLIFFSFYFYSLLFSQTPPYYNYTSANGLASSSAIEIIQDKDGYIWIATNNGLSRFDGTKFKNFGIKEGLNSTTIAGIVEGNDGEIYIGNYEKGINLYKNNKITSFTSSTTDRIRDLFVENNNLYAHSTNGQFIIFKNGLSEILKEVPNKDTEGFKILTNRIKKLQGGMFLALTSEGLYKFANSEFIKINIEGLNDKEIHSIAEDVKGNLYAGGKGKIYVLNNYKVINTIDIGSNDKIFAIMIDSHENIWYTGMNKGFKVIYKNSNKVTDISGKLKIPKASINKFLEDFEGNIWVSTFGKGIFCLNNLYLNNYNEDDGLSNNNVQAFEKDKSGRLIIGTYNGINVFHEEKFEVLKLGQGITDYVYELQFRNSKIYVSYSNLKNVVQKKTFSGLEFVYIYGPSFYISKDTNYYLGGWGNNYYKNKELTHLTTELYKVLVDNTYNNRVNKFFEDSDRNLWIGTTFGLCKIINDEKKYFSNNEILNSSVKSIVEDNQKKIWFACEKGVANYDLKTSLTTNFPNFGEHDLSSSTSLAIDKNNRLWIGNSKGLFMRDDNNSIKYFNTLTGLPSNEILSLFYVKEKNILWVGTSNGFSSFDINYFDNQRTAELNVKINYVKSGDSIYTRLDTLIFEPKNNNIYIDFNAINFSSPASLTYQYKLEEEWNNGETDFLDFSSMKAGLYNLSIRAKTQNTGWSKPTFLSFTVKPKFIETIWFQLLIFLCASSIVLFVAKRRIKLNRKKSFEQIELTKRMNDLKHQALSAMMNPHFIFNSLNSVQYLVNTDRKIEANDYIAMMGKLIRKNLDIAGNSFILLTEERDRLELYLEIEKLRFQDKFAYEINVGNAIDINSASIPNMIIQPFVENAVWHGIMNSGRKGFVKISFEFENMNIDANDYRCLVIKIKDNGIGYNKSKENKKEGHISKGIKIIEERLRILSSDLKLPQPVIIQDLSQRSENSTGTEVIISLPPTLYKTINVISD